MDKIRNVLLLILFIQFLIFLYVKLIYEENLKPLPASCETEVEQIALNTLVNESIQEIVHGSKELPQSTAYTVWDKKMIAKLNAEIQLFNEEIRKIVATTLPVESLQAPNESREKELKVVKKEVPKPKPKTPITFKVAQFAKKKLGTKYVWGATGPNKFDCSGFTREVYKSTTGIKIPRVSRDQAKVGTYVKFSELRRGDMVFFDTEKKYTGKVNHVGIYLSNNNFIHASSAGKKVIITNFKKKPFYKKRFLWGRRIVENQS
jgi:cell wall-associated NlpC family hydrolase